MRILAVTQYGYPGLTPVSGADVMLHSMLSYMVKDHWVVGVLFVSKICQDREVDGVVVQSYSGGIDQAISVSSRIFDDEARPEVIITHLGGIQVARAMGRLWDIPVVQVIHNTNDLTIGSLASGCDLALYNSEWIREFHHTVALGKPFVREWLEPGRSRMRKRVSRSWPSMILHPPALAPCELRQCPVGDDNIVGIVNLSPNKGSDVVAGILDERPDVHIMGITGGYDTFKQAVFNRENFVYREHTSDMSSFYHDIDLLIVPSIYESYSLAAVEAMGHGLPVIASDTPGLRESVADGGQHLGTRDPKIWAEAIDQTFSNYDYWAEKAQKRHSFLHAQSQEELRVFENALKELVNGSDLNGVPGVSPGF